MSEQSDLAYKNMKRIVGANCEPVSVLTTNLTGPNYKYSEGEFIENALNHIDATYAAHYSSGIQTTEFIMANAETLDFLKGNVFKYIQRYGKKDGRNIKDLYKAVHYICMMAHYSKDKQ
jgi:hypothetical protein